MSSLYRYWHILWPGVNTQIWWLSKLIDDPIIKASAPWRRIVLLKISNHRNIHLKPVSLDNKLSSRGVFSCISCFEKWRHGKMRCHKSSCWERVFIDNLFSRWEADCRDLPSPDSPCALTGSDDYNPRASFCDKWARISDFYNIVNIGVVILCK